MMDIRITLVAGWHDTIEAARAFMAQGDDHWTGTIAEFWKLNPSMTYGEMSDIAALSRTQVHFLGGGAAACFTVIRAHEGATA